MKSRLKKKIVHTIFLEEAGTVSKKEILRRSMKKKHNLALRCFYAAYCRGRKDGVIAQVSFRKNINIFYKIFTKMEQVFGNSRPGHAL